MIKQKNRQRHQKFLILLGAVLCYVSTVDYVSVMMESQRARRLELNLEKTLSQNLEQMWVDIRLEEEDTIQRIINVIDRYRTWLSADQKKNLAELIFSESRNYQYDPFLVVAVIMKESSFDPQAISWKGARGLMQLKPATGKEVARKIGLEWEGIESLHDPSFNIKSGIYYLAAQQKRFGDLHTSLAAYNHGPTAIRRIIAKGRKVPQRYAKKVMLEYEKLKKEMVEIL
jgi:soluble lytic murein transglycosylase